MPTPRPAPAELAARRRTLLVLHHRHAGRVRALFYWFGAELEAIDGAVLRTFLLAARHDPPERAPLAWLARIAWRVASRPDPAPDHDHDHPPASPHLPPAADLLARLLAVHAPTPPQRAAFVLSELAGLPLPILATTLARDPEVLRHELTRLRHAIADDREVIALGGPRPLLLASLAPFVDDPRWLRHQTTRLLAALPPTSLSFADPLRRPQGILALGLVAVTILLLLRPDPPVAKPRPAAPLVVAQPIAPPPVAAPPLPLPVPPVMSPEPAPKLRVARKSPRPPRAPKPDRLAERERLARARDPGAIIIELEMLGAGRKSLPANPRQALAYAEQHARDYPQSQLANQRAELRVRALCALGRRDEARSEANRTQAPKVQDALRDACKP